MQAERVALGPTTSLLGAPEVWPGSCASGLTHLGEFRDERLAVHLSCNIMIVLQVVNLDRLPPRLACKLGLGKNVDVVLLGKCAMLAVYLTLCAQPAAEARDAG